MKRKLLAFGVAGLVVLLVASICLAEVEFSVGGHFRARSYLVTNPDLVKDGPERSYVDQRLILDPVLKLSDAIQVKARIRALDYVWDETILTPNLAIAPDMYRAWVQVALGEYGSLQIGRQPADMWHNYVVSEENTYPRYHYITPVFNVGNGNGITGGFLYEKIEEGDIDKAGDDSFAWCPWVLFTNPNVTVGYSCYVLDKANVGNAIMNDAMINAKIGPVDVKSEVTLSLGKAVPLSADYKHNLSFFVDAGVPIEASPYVDRASVMVGLFQGKTDSTTDVTGSLRADDDWIDEWKIDLILWDQLYSTIDNAWIIRPKIDFVVPDTRWGGYLSACMSFADQEAKYQVYPGPDGLLGTADDITGQAPNGADLTDGTEKSIGTEIDLGINYTLGPRQTIELVAGMLMPGKYFHEDNRDITIGMALKTHIRF